MVPYLGSKCYKATWLAQSSDDTNYRGGDDVRLPGVHAAWFPKATGWFKAAMTQRIWGRWRCTFKSYLPSGMCELDATPVHCNSSWYKDLIMATKQKTWVEVQPILSFYTNLLPQLLSKLNKMSEYIRTEKLTWMNIQMNICDSYIFKYSKIFVTLWCIYIWLYVKGGVLPFLRVWLSLPAAAESHKWGGCWCWCWLWWWSWL